MGLDQVLGAVPVLPCQHPCPQGLDEGAWRIWGSGGLRAEWTPLRIPPFPRAVQSLLLHFAPWAVVAGQEALGAAGCALGQHGSCSHSLFSGLGKVLGLPAAFCG